MAGVILTDGDRVDLALPGLLFRRVIAGLIAEHEREGIDPETHTMMPSLKLFDLAAAQALAGLTDDRAQKIGKRAWAVVSRAVKPLEGRPLATAVVAATAMVRAALADGALTMDEDGPFKKAFDLMVAATDADEKSEEALRIVQRSGEKAGLAMLELLRQEGRLKPPTRHAA